MKTKLVIIPNTRERKISKGGSFYYVSDFKCSCGRVKKFGEQNVKHNRTNSCGCIRHLQSRTRLYKVWVTMKARCKNKNCNLYKYYGARGIKFCKEWKNYTEFYSWSTKSGYKQGLSIDRIDNNGDYTPVNCRWVTSKEQSRNTRQNIVFSGEIARDASKRLGGHIHLVTDRIRRGWTYKEAFNRSLKIKKCIN